MTACQIGFHFQDNVQGWPEAVRQLPAGTWCKVFQVEMARDIKAVNPGVRVVFRYWDDPNQQFDGDYSAAIKRAREFYARWCDGTFAQYAQFLDAFEGWNEFIANSQNPAERLARIWSVQAKIEVWEEEYSRRPELAHLRGVFANTAVGNDIPWEIAKAVADSGHILGYHPYIAFNGVNSSPSQGEWLWASGRHLMSMDAAYRSRGIEVDWLGTEFGLCRDANGAGWLQPNDGWGHPEIFGGFNIDETARLYLDYWSENHAAWNGRHGNRSLGAVIFTSRTVAGVWSGFNLVQPHLSEFAKRFAAWKPSHLPLPTPDPVPAHIPLPHHKALWAESIRRQVVSLNSDAGLQSAMVKDGFTPVGTEFRYTVDGIEYAAQAGEKPSGKGRRTYVAIVPQWDRIEWYTE